MRAHVSSVHDAHRHAGGQRVEALMGLRTVGWLVTLALSLLVAPLCADAQPPATVPRIGYLSPGSPASPAVEAFRQALRELGWVEGQNIVIEWRYTEGQFDRFPDLAAEFVRLRMDVIVSSAGRSIPALKHATQTIPIVMLNVSDPVQSGLVASLARPGGNITGVVNLTHELDQKRLELLKEAVPSITRMAVLWDPSLATHVQGLRDLEAVARAVGVQLHPLAVQSLDELESAFVAMRRDHTDALLVFGSALHGRHIRRIAELALQGRLPTIYEYRALAEVGGLMTYGPNVREMHRRAASYVDKLLKGAKPADLPVERPMKFELIINLKTAQALGIMIPPHLLVLADEVIK
jgi:putative ABC transport system substrate-binding protein